MATENRISGYSRPTALLCWEFPVLPSIIQKSELKKLGKNNWFSWWLRLFASSALVSGATFVEFVVQIAGYWLNGAYIPCWYSWESPQHLVQLSRIDHWSSPSSAVVLVVWWCSQSNRRPTFVYSTWEHWEFDSIEPEQTVDSQSRLQFGRESPENQWSSWRHLARVAILSPHHSDSSNNRDELSIVARCSTLDRWSGYNPRPGDEAAVPTLPVATTLYWPQLCSLPGSPKFDSPNRNPPAPHFRLSDWHSLQSFSEINRKNFAKFLPYDRTVRRRNLFAQWCLLEHYFRSHWLHLYRLLRKSWLFDSKSVYAQW